MQLFKKIPPAFYILCCYVFLSGYFAFERILNTDNSYYFFNLVNTQKFWFAEHRMGVFPSQIPLLLSVYMGVPLNALIYIYSLSFPVLYTAIALFCRYYLQVKEAALLMALMLVTGVSYSFFHPATETYHALAFAILLYALLVSPPFQQNPLLYFGGILAVSVLSLVSHPIAAFVICFVALFALLNKQIKIIPFVFVVLLGASSALLRLILVDPASYDVRQYDSLFANITAVNEWSEVYPFIYFLSRLPNVYLSTAIIVIVLSVITLRTKKLLILASSLLCATGFAIMAGLTFIKGDAEMMMEKTFMPSLFMLLLPFCYFIIRDTAFSKTAQNTILTIIAFCGFIQIINAAVIASKRLHALEMIATSAQHPKLIAEIDDFNDPSLYFNHWNTPVDSYIIAKCKSNKTFTLFLTGDKHSFKFDSTDTQLFLGPPWAPYWNKKMVNSAYFALPATGYRIY